MAETKTVTAAPVADIKRTVGLSGNDADDFRARQSDFRKRRGMLTKAYNAAKRSARQMLNAGPRYADRGVRLMREAYDIYDQGSRSGIKVGGLVSADRNTQRLLREQAQEKANVAALQEAQRANPKQALKTAPTAEEVRREQAGTPPASKPAPAGKRGLSVNTHSDDEEATLDVNNIPTGVEIAPLAPGLTEPLGVSSMADAFDQPDTDSPYYVNRSLLSGGPPTI